VSGVRFALNVTDLKAGVEALKTKFPYAIKRAVMKAANSGRVEMARSMAGDTGLPVRRIQSQIKVSSVGEFGAEVEITGARLPLIDFGARGPEPSRGKGRGVTYRLKGGRGRVPNAFIATMPSGHRGVFVRRGAPRLPIVELKGPSLVRVFTRFIPAGQARAQAALVINIKHEIAFALSRR
jgi:hypothetical protein